MPTALTNSGHEYMQCDTEGCKAEATHSSSRWITIDHLAVDYWCKKHAPEVEVIEEPDDAETGAAEA